MQDCYLPNVCWPDVPFVLTLPHFNILSMGKQASKGSVIHPSDSQGKRIVMG